MSQDDIIPLVRLLAGNRLLVLSFATLLLSLLLIVMGMWLLRLCAAVKKLSVWCGSAVDREQSRVTFQRRIEVSLREMREQLAEERLRINAVQRLTVEVKEQQTVLARAVGSLSRAEADRIDGRPASSERRLAGSSERTADLDDPSQGEAVRQEIQGNERR